MPGFAFDSPARSVLALTRPSVQTTTTEGQDAPRLSDSTENSSGIRIGMFA